MELLNPTANKRLNMFVLEGVPYELVETSKIIDIIPVE